MLQHPDPRVQRSSILEHSSYHHSPPHQQNCSFRLKVHSLMTQNFQLKESINSLESQLQKSFQTQQDLKSQLRSVLQQLSTNDNLIEHNKHNQQELTLCINQLQEELASTRAVLGEEKEAIQKLMEHNSNLETQAQLVNDIKQKYQLELTRLRVETEHLQKDHMELSAQNMRLKSEIGALLHDIDDQDQQLAARRTQMQEYQTYVLTRIKDASSSPQFHLKCSQEKDKYLCKYLKYKQKARCVKHERDQLLRQFTAVNQELGSQSMRKYVE